MKQALLIGIGSPARVREAIELLGVRRVQHGVRHLDGVGHAAELLDALAEKGGAEQDHLEAVVIGRIVAAGDLDAAVHVELGFGEIGHRGRP